MKPLKPRKETEKAIESRLRARLSKAGTLTIKMHGGQFQAGLPDLLVLAPGKPTRFVEMKRPGGKLSKRQKLKFARMAEHGALIWVSDTDDPAVLDGPPNLEEWL